MNWSGSFPPHPDRCCGSSNLRTFPGGSGVAKGIPTDNERLVRSGCVLKMRTSSCAVGKSE